jgi:4-hydroxy-3-polyprenylbenzoate decarboxylase
MPKRLTVAITGASGVVYGREFCRFLAAAPVNVDFVVSANGQTVCRHELGLTQVTPESLVGRPVGNFTAWSNDDLAAGPSSGSYPSDGMIVVPASGHAVASIAHGISENLIVRAALVTLKQRRPLVVVPRETPLGIIELRNQLALAEAGAVVLPASPGFYQQPKSIDDLVKFIVGRAAELLGLPHELYKRWTGPEG